MKEITSIITLKFTKIAKVEDEKEEMWVKCTDNDRDILAEDLKGLCGLDHVSIEQIQHFVRDIEGK